MVGRLCLTDLQSSWRWVPASRLRHAVSTPHPKRSIASERHFRSFRRHWEALAGWRVSVWVLARLHGKDADNVRPPTAINVRQSRQSTQKQLFERQISSLTCSRVAPRERYARAQYGFTENQLIINRSCGSVSGGAKSSIRLALTVGNGEGLPV